MVSRHPETRGETQNCPTLHAGTVTTLLWFTVVSPTHIATLDSLPSLVRDHGLPGAWRQEGRRREGRALDPPQRPPGLKRTWVHLVQVCDEGTWEPCPGTERHKPVEAHCRSFPVPDTGLSPWCTPHCEVRAHQKHLPSLHPSSFRTSDVRHRLGCAHAAPTTPLPVGETQRGTHRTAGSPCRHSRAAPTSCELFAFGFWLSDLLVTKYLSWQLLIW